MCYWDRTYILILATLLTLECGLAGGFPLSPGFGVLFSKWDEGPSRSSRTLEPLSFPIPPSFSLGLCLSLSLRLRLSNLSERIFLLFHQRPPLSQATLLSHLQKSLLSHSLCHFIPVCPPPRIPVSPAHPFPKPLSIHLENLGKKYLAKNEYPQNGETQKGGPDGRN